ncbi:hypothetical protein TCSYLVIO_005864, partial [Trypanosoma cruzi]
MRGDINEECCFLRPQQARFFLRLMYESICVRALGGCHLNWEPLGGALDQILIAPRCILVSCGKKW